MDNKQKYSDVPLRIKSWGIIILVFFSGIFNTYTISIFVTFLIIWSQYEYLKIFNLYTRYSLCYLLLFSIIEFLSFIFLSFKSILFINILMIFIQFIFSYYTFKSLKKSFIYLFPIGLLILSLPFLVQIRIIDYNQDFAKGILLLILLVVPTELNDVFQYLSGKIFGKRKITPKISPNKTLEGLLGGIILTMILFVLLCYLILGQFHFRFIILGVMISFLGFIGDIMFSFAKRNAGVKDAGKLIPGHGGLLDRIDSLVLVCPLFYWFLVCLKVY